MALQLVAIEDLPSDVVDALAGPDLGTELQYVGTLADIGTRKLNIVTFDSWYETMKADESYHGWLAKTHSRREPPARFRGPAAPRARRSHRLAAGHRRSSTTSRGSPSDDDGPPRPGAAYGFGLTCCPTCGEPLLLADGILACGTRTCPRWGRPS